MIPFVMATLWAAFSARKAFEEEDDLSFQRALLAMLSISDYQPYLADEEKLRELLGSDLAGYLRIDERLVDEAKVFAKIGLALLNPATKDMAPRMIEALGKRADYELGFTMVSQFQHPLVNFSIDPMVMRDWAWESDAGFPRGFRHPLLVLLTVTSLDPMSLEVMSLAGHRFPASLAFMTDAARALLIPGTYIYRKQDAQKVFKHIFLEPNASPEFQEEGEELAERLTEWLEYAQPGSFTSMTTGLLSEHGSEIAFVELLITVVDPMSSDFDGTVNTYHNPGGSPIGMGDLEPALGIRRLRLL